MIIVLGFLAQDTENDFMGENVKPLMYHKNNLANIIWKCKFFLNTHFNSITLMINPLGSANVGRFSSANYQKKKGYRKERMILKQEEGGQGNKFKIMTEP